MRRAAPHRTVLVLAIYLIILWFQGFICNALIRGDTIDNGLKDARSVGNLPRDASSYSGRDVFLGPVFLRIVDDDFVEVAAGNPGHMTKLRLDFSRGDVLIYEALSQRSQTFDIETGADGSSTGSEIFYLERYKLRLPFRFTQNVESPHSPLYHTTAHAGVLGLGASSPLWRHWNCYTVAGNLLILGAYDAHLPPLGPAFPLDTPVDAQLTHLRTLDGADSPATALHDALRGAFDLETVVAHGGDLEPRGAWRWAPQEHARLRLTLSDADALLPPGLARSPCVVLTLTAPPADTTVLRDATLANTSTQAVLVVDTVHRLVTAAGFSYYALRRDAAPGDVLQLGAVALRRFTLHVDAVRRTVRLAPSFWGATGGAARLAVAREREACADAGNEPQSAALDLNLVGMFALLAAALAWLLVGADAHGGAAGTAAAATGTAGTSAIGAGYSETDAIRAGYADPCANGADCADLDVIGAECAGTVASGAGTAGASSQRLLVLLQLYVLVLAPLLFAVNVFALDVAPLVEQYARASGPLVLALLGGALVFALVLSAAGAALGAPAETRRGALVLAASATLWLVALPRHDDGGGAGAFMMFLVGAAAACGAAMDLLAAATRCWRGASAPGWLLVDAIVAGATSAIVVRLDAYVLMHGRGGADVLVPTLFLWAAFVLAPAFAFHLAYEMRALALPHAARRTP